MKLHKDDYQTIKETPSRPVERRFSISGANVARWLHDSDRVFYKTLSFALSLVKRLEENKKNG